MNTINILYSDNIKDPETAKRINKMMQRIVDSKVNAGISVTNYNADPVEFVYTFSTKEEAENYAYSKVITDANNFEHKVVQNRFYEYHPVDSLPK